MLATTLGLLRFALIGIATFYIAILVILWSMQSRLLYPAPQHRPAPPAGFSEVFLSAEDGIETRAFFRPAEDGLPTVLFYHGNGETLDGSIAGTRALAERGYGLLLPEFRGYGGNPGTPSEEGFYADGRAAMAWLEQNGIDRGQTIISAFSIGTGKAVQLATEHDIAALMLIAPFRSLAGLASEKLPWLPVRWLIQDHYESQEKLTGFSKPVLIAHGSADTLIPAAHGRDLAKTTPDATFLLFDGLGHNQMYHGDVMVAQLEWLNMLDLGRGE